MSEKDVEIEVRLDDATLARLDWIAEVSWTDRETVLRVVLALNVAPGGHELMDKLRAGEVANV
jgi:predicted transcriptional regulator